MLKSIGINADRYSYIDDFFLVNVKLLNHRLFGAFNICCWQVNLVDNWNDCQILYNVLSKMLILTASKAL